MLRTRVLTAAGLLVVLVGIAVFAPAFAFDALLLAIVVLACLEWFTLLGLGKATAAATSAVFFLAALAMLWATPGVMAAAQGVGDGVLVIYAVVSVIWLFLVPFALRRFSPLAAKGLAASSLALIMCFAAWLALLQADGIGKGFLLSLLLLVWVADTAAYFAGKAFGRHKLAPAISPGKTWEGVAGALIANAGLAMGAAGASLQGWISPGGNLFSMLQITHGWLFMLLVTVLLTMLGVVGDLYESLVKRTAGAKDSGRLLPGHGGVYDRIDALLAVFPVAMCIVTLIQSEII
jgi:phosphatidate cytidylyltransferase